MTDDERIQALQTSVVQAMNASNLPLGVKALVLENAWLKIAAAMQPSRQDADAHPQE